ncbi:hypothetical protein [Xylella fastidiosa]|uniref:hypothetical protein n=1 Tax=Xylella fastidiosa TaxID=2371 RepID=UPI0007661B86|nr:hypothetical protein [Xylella fastidiosa]ALR01495.1 hypothetical protein OY18_03775 [Xylella fastidiosa]ALR02161.1 hypothetical protein OY18_07890 [Xylella fastidiosa]KXB13037.1 hypothetical protein ADT29_08945 [Xylella fastidiosa]KXB19369.1 hypothetical protein ADT28_10160 [Xylella fastidiosa]MDG5822850.1 hypothetical protein [Xylella fastidiosa subsp. pauca]
MTTIMLRNTRTCDVTLDGVTIQAGRTQALEAAHVEQLRQHPGIGLWFDNGYLVEQEMEPSCAPVGGGEGQTDPATEEDPATETDPTTEKPPVREEAPHDAAPGKPGKSRRT